MMNKIPKMDYVIVTMNDMLGIFDAIASIERQHNVNRLIVVQSLKGSDEQAEAMIDLKECGSINVLLFEDKGLAYARRMAIDEVETEWFVVVDGDVVLCDDWSKQMEQQLAETILLNEPKKVGAICGPLYRNKVHHEWLKKAPRSIRETDFRLFTYDTIILTDAVRDWEVDESVNSYEDYLLTQHITALGYGCYFVPVFSYHNHQGSDFKAGAWNGAGGRMVGVFTNIWQALYSSLRTFGGGLKLGIEMRSKWFIIYSFRVSCGILYGYIRWKRYIHKEACL